MMKHLAPLRVLAAVVVVLAGGGVAHAAPLKQYAYSPNAVYTVHAGLGIATQIVISPREEVKDFGTGFSAAWDLVRRDNVFYLKPKSPHAETNMYIRTDRRNYLFDLHVVVRKWKTLAEAKRAGVDYRITFTYPQERDESDPQGAGEPRRAGGLIQPVSEKVPNGNYDYAAGQDSQWLVPRQVYDDGKFTYITLDPHQMPGGGMPSVYGKKKEDGEEFLVNTRQEKDRLTIFGHYDYLVLRHGDSVVGLRRSHS